MERGRFRLLLGALVLVGLVARLWNVDFDQRQHLHPDERFWAMVADGLDTAPRPDDHGTVVGPVLDWLDADRSPANPYRATESFLYGPLPLAVSKAAASWLHDGASNGAQPANAVVHLVDRLGVPLLDDAGAPRFDDRYQVDLIGRMIGAILDAITIAVIGLIARRLAGPHAGLAAAFLYAGCVLAIQYSHFLGDEPMLGLACALTLLAALRLDRSDDVGRGARSAAVVGVCAGLAVAVKLTAAGLVVVPAVGLVYLAVRYRRRSDLVRLAVMGVVTALSFRVFHPGAFDGLGFGLSQSFLDDVGRASRLRNDNWPPAFQWADRVPVLQPLRWLVVYSLGPGMALAAIVGAVVVASSSSVFRRLVPGVAGRTLAARWARLASVIEEPGVAARWPRFLLVAGTVAPFAFIVATSFPTARYFYPMVPAVCVLGGLGLVGAGRVVRASAGPVRVVSQLVIACSVVLPIVWAVGFVNGVYHREHTRIEASHWIAQNVPDGSVLTAQTWDDSLPLRLPGLDPARYPLEQLDLVGPDDEAKVVTLADRLLRADYVVESSPRLWDVLRRMPARFPSTIRFFDSLDSGSIGFERVATFRSGIRLGPWRLDETAAEEAFSVYDHPEVRIWEKVREVPRATILAALDRDLAAAAIPIHPARGTANGLMLHQSELAANAGGPTYDEAFATRGSGLFHAFGWFAVMELLGLATFVLALPILRRFPDAGLGISKALAAVATSFVLFVAVAWSGFTFDRTLVALVMLGVLGAAGRQAWRRRAMLADLWRERRRILIAAEAVTLVVFWAAVALRARNPDLWHRYRSGEKPFEQALLTAVLRTETLPVYDPWFSGGSLNYYYGGWMLVSVPARLLRTAPTVAMNLGIGLIASCGAGASYTLIAALAAGRRDRWRSQSRRARRAVLAGVVGSGFLFLLPNSAVLVWAWQRIAGTARPGPVDWWGLSRVIPDSVAVTEFPAWSFLFADLHPHVMGIPVLLLTGVFSLALIDALARHEWRRALPIAAMTGVAVGFVRMTNTWDLPVALAVVALVLIVAPLRGARWRDVIASAGLVAVTLLVAYMPYVRRGEVFDGGFEPATLRTPPHSWFEQFGFFAVVGGVTIAVAISRAVMAAPLRWRGWSRGHVIVLALAIVSLGYAGLRPELVVFQLTASLAVGSVWVASQDLASRTAHSARVGALVAALGWAIQAGVELMTVRNDGGRMNTVFKFWYASWTVLAVATAIIVVGELTSRRGLRRSATAALGFAVIATAVFWVAATPARLDDRVSTDGWSLDGESYLRQDPVAATEERWAVVSDDRPLIDWLRANVSGIRVVAEAPGIDYFWTSRVSWSTGLPTPIGWAYHQQQQRRPYGAIVDTRVADMNTLYTTTDAQEMARVLARYSVEYVVFGTQEAELATSASVDALRSFDCLEVTKEADRRLEDSSVEADALFVARVDRGCVSRLRAVAPAPLSPP